MYHQRTHCKQQLLQNSFQTVANAFREFVQNKEYIFCQILKYQIFGKMYTKINCHKQQNKVNKNKTHV